VAGTQALLEALDGDFPELVVLFSSMAAITGDLGQVDYTAANAYLDAAAQSESGRGRRVISINWDAWRDVGMAADTTEYGALSGYRAEVVSRGIAPALGVDALFRIASSPAPQVIVSAAGLDVRLAEADAAARFVAAAAAPRATTHARPDLGTEYVAPHTDDERRLARIWEDLLGIAGIGVHDNFFELGGDSLLATALIARVRDRFGRDCSLRDVVGHATIGAFAAFSAGAEAGVTVDERAALLDELATLSDEEAEARLRALLDQNAGGDRTSVA
jgi:hypothetical protein